MIQKDICNFHLQVQCFTFNHSSYIREALNGFTIQQTTFPFVCTIIDDASTDGEPDIIQSYLEQGFILNEGCFLYEENDDFRLVFARHRVNKNCHFAVFYLKYNHYSIKKDVSPYFSEITKSVKYQAFCEGDDYWIDSLKLQKQYEILEANPNYSLCCHNAIKYFMDSKTVRPFNENIFKGVLTAGQIIGRWMIPTASMFLRSENVAYPEWMVRIYSGDMALYLRCLNAGDIYYIDDIMSIYRINLRNGSASANLKGKGVFIIEQQNLLLESFNKGTNYKYNDVIIKKLRNNKQYISYLKCVQKNKLLCVFEPFLYKNIIEIISKRIRKFVKTIKSWL